MSVPVDDTVKIKARSIMGTEIPLVQHQEKPMELAYGFNNTSEALDIARERFERVKELTSKLSMVENSAYRLAKADSSPSGLYFLKMSSPSPLT